MKREEVQNLIEKLSREGLEVTMPEHTIASLCQRSKEISQEKGWLNEDGTDPRPFHTVCALFHSELSEAFEELRNNRKLNETYYEFVGPDDDIKRQYIKEDMVDWDLTDRQHAKPCGFPTELADFIIRICQFFGSQAGGAEAFDKLCADERKALGGDRLRVGEPERLIATLHADVSFALVAALKGLDDTTFPSTSPPYFAAALMTVFDFCEENGIDLWAAIDEKEAYNRTRPMRHGGKSC